MNFFWSFLLAALPALVPFALYKKLMKGYAVHSLFCIIAAAFAAFTSVAALLAYGLFVALACAFAAIAALLRLGSLAFLARRGIPYRLVENDGCVFLSLCNVVALTLWVALFSACEPPGFIMTTLYFLVGMGLLALAGARKRTVVKIERDAVNLSCFNLEGCRQFVTKDGAERPTGPVLVMKGEKDEEAKDESDVEEEEFIRFVLEALCQEGRLVAEELNGETVYFSPDYHQKMAQRVEDATAPVVRVPAGELHETVAEGFQGNKTLAEAFINRSDGGVAFRQFRDGSYYVNDLHCDSVRVCSVCGLAELADDEEPEPGEHFCSDFCRETEEMSARLMDELRTQKYKEAGIEAASFGGGLPLALRAIVENRRGVASMSGKGHGIAAEQANTMIDKLLLRDASVVGDSNAKNGADRIVNGVKIQSKYCATASRTVGAAFGADGNYRYYNADGKPMVLEVPRDQYPKAVAQMRERIKNGKVPGVTNPDEAEKLVRKGWLTYEQAVNATKPVTIESILLDSATGAVVGLVSGGISFALTTALAYYNTKDLKRSMRASVGTALQTGGKAWAAYVLVAQAQKTQFVKEFLSKSAIDINWQGHGKVVSRLGKGLAKTSGAKSGTITKNANAAVKGAIVTATATFVVTSAFEVGRMCGGRISGMQCFKNIVVSGGGIAGGTAGALFGAALGSPIPVLGPIVGGMIGGAVGGMIGGGVSKAAMDQFIEDDAVMVMTLVSDQFKVIAAAHCCNAKEIREATAALDKMILAEKDFVETVYSQGDLRRQYVSRVLMPIFVRIVMQRPILRMADLSDEAIEAAVADEAA